MNSKCLHDLGRLFICSALIIFLVGITSESKATHAAGAELTYKCIGGMQYELIATFYRDCNGTPEPNSVTIKYESASCSYSRMVIASKVAGSNGEEITMPCATASSSCNGGFTTGLRKWVYKAVVTLPFACNDWVISYRVCCRNCTITTIQSPCASGSELYVEALLNNLDAPCNSSPVYNNDPVVFICVGQNFNFNQGAYDTDGDSLAYELITPKISADDVISWTPPMTAQSPLLSSTPFTINQVTGDVNFTPSAIQIGIIAVKISEYREGQFIGSTIRDMQVYTQNCFNNVPSATGIDSSSAFSKTACAGESICFDIFTSDIDSGQVVTVEYDNLPVGAAIYESSSSRPQLEFCWTPQISDISTIPYVFTLSVRDDACPLNSIQTYSYSVTVSGPELIISTTDPDCGNPGSGSATLTGTGITGAGIVWNTIPPQNTTTATGLSPGNYEVVVTDVNGCTSSAQAVIVPSINAINVSASGLGTISCQSGNIGQGTASVSGGTPPYNYEWSNGSATQNISGLSSGIYTVTVTDNNGCKSSDTIEIGQIHNDLNVILSSGGTINCFGDSSGTATAMVVGGVAPYTYIWSNGATSSGIDSLIAGNYNVTVTDANGCSESVSVNIEQPLEPLQVNTSILQNVNCYNSSTGQISIDATGGTMPYNFIWSNGSVGSGISNLIAGVYTVTVTDNNGCIGSITNSIGQPLDSVRLNLVTKSDVLCFGSNNGEIKVSATGGSGPYSYLWNTGSTSDNITGLSAGSYSVSVTDNNGCSTGLEILINQPDSILNTAIVSVDHPSCNQSTGSIQTLTSGGTQPYYYTWSTGATTQSISGIPSGSYLLTTSDQNGCTTQNNVELINIGNDINIIQDTLINVNCKGENTGMISVQVSGGVQPYSFVWSNGATGNSIIDLAAGNYSVTITDNSGCMSDTSFNITEPLTQLTVIENNHKDVLCFGDATGQITVSATGGSLPYNYVWNNGNTTSSGSGLTAGMYTITVTDTNGCMSTLNSEVVQPLSSVTGSVTIIEQVTCIGNGSAIANGTGGTGMLNYVWSNGSAGAQLNNIGAGTYSVTITDQAGCEYTESVTFPEPGSNISIAGVIVQGDCQSGAVSSINTSVAGGNPPYKFAWDNGDTTQNINTNVPGVYTLVVTDASGCTRTESFEITTNNSLVLVTSGNDTICSGDLTTLTIDSVPGATYQWYFNGGILNGATGTAFTTPAEGLYSVKVTNGCGTFDSDTMQVVVKSIGNVSVSNQQIICPPETATLIATGGTRYSWTPATYITFTDVPDPIVSPLSTTTYTVDVTNEFGCKTSLSTVVAVVCDSLLVPTGFSPNDDGTNDGYVIEGIEDYPGNKLWVYNRWGKLVFKASDYMNNWDGVSNISGVFEGRKVPVGTYYYILDLNDRSKPRSGYLIIRH